MRYWVDVSLCWSQSAFFLWVGLSCPTKLDGFLDVLGWFSMKIERNSVISKIFRVPNKFGFSGFPDKKHSVWNLPVHELSYLSNADLAMVSQLEGFESAPKAPEKLYFHVLLGVFYYQIRDFRKLYSKSGLYWIPPARIPPTGDHETRTEELFALALTLEHMTVPVMLY